MDVNGSWINQNGSVVEIRVDDGGQITGSYRSGKGRAAAGIDYPIQGRLNGELIVFYVDWRNQESNLAAITSFMGRCSVDEHGCDSIHTVWLLAREFDDEAQAHRTQVWNTFLTNSDVFLRMQTDDP